MMQLLCLLFSLFAKLWVTNRSLGLGRGHTSPVEQKRDE